MKRKIFDKNYPQHSIKYEIADDFDLDEEMELEDALEGQLYVELSSMGISIPELEKKPLVEAIE